MVLGKECPVLFLRSDESGEPEPPAKRPLLALREFYAALTLTAEDEKAILDKRGLPAEACKAFGVKSSLRSNQDVLEKLRGKFSDDDLCSAGLFKSKDGRAARDINPPSASPRDF